MEFLANENFPAPSIKLLRNSGYTVRSVSEENWGIADRQVVETASINDLVILTFDSDYGELIYKYGLKDPPAVIYFRYRGTEPEFSGQQLLLLLKKGELNFNGHFTVIEEQKIRQRQY